MSLAQQPSAALGSTILRVYSYEPGTKSTKQKKTLELPSDQDLSKITLEFIRGLLVEKKVFDSPDVKAPFCDIVGAEMDDSMTFSVYLDQFHDEEKKNDDEQGDEQQGDDGKNGENAGEQEVAGGKHPIGKSNKQEATSPAVKFLKVYYKKRKVQGKMDDTAKEFLKKQLDLKLQSAPKLKDLRAKLLSSAFSADSWKASTDGKRSVAANLNERDWSVITRTNCLLSGFKLIFESKPAKKDKSGQVVKEARMVPLGVERSPYNAFKLKARIFDDYEVAAPPSEATGGKGSTTNGEPLNLSFRIPRFQVEDSSYVNVTETNTEVQSSLAKSSFSESSMEASAGGGFWGVSAAVKAGFAKEGKEQNLTANSEKEDQIHITYNFPRVTLFLDANSLELTAEVKDDIAKVKNQPTLEAFREKYGDVFSRRVRLGGKLTSTSHLKSEAQSKKEQLENSLKIAAAASFSGPYGSASAEGSSSSGDNNDQDISTQELSNNLSWEASGGDTTLCNDPPKWCGTVGSFYNWRVVEYDDPISLPKFISTFKGFEDVEQKFDIAAGYEPLETGKHVYIDVKLFEEKTGLPLIASTEVNPLHCAVEKIIQAHPNESPSFGTSKDDLLRQISAGGVFIDSAKSDKKEQIWTLARWAKKGDDGKHHPYGVKTYLFNKSIRKGLKYLGVTDAISRTDASGFLHPTDESQKAWFTLQQPSGTAPKIGPIRTGDIVELRVRDKGDSADLGFLMKSKYVVDDDDELAREINQEIQRVPGFAPRKEVAASLDNQTVNEDDGRFLRFRVEVVQS